MSFNNAYSYMRLSNYKDALGDEYLIYIYAKEKELVDQQLSRIKLFCKDNDIKTSKIYIDIGGSNKLDNKLNLKKLISGNKDNNILISDVTRLTRNTMELFELKNLCKKNNINIFDISSKEFVLDGLSNSIEQIQKDLINKGSDENLQRNLDVLLVKPNKVPVKKTIKNTLEEKERLVGGDIEYTYLENCNDVAIVYNENHKKLNLPINRDIGHDIISGNFFIVGDDPELGEDRSLTQKQIDKYSKYFGKKSIEKINNKSMNNSLDDYSM